MALILPMTVACQQVQTPTGKIEQKQVVTGSYLGMEETGK